jgi:prepilin peptidase CpaA
MQDFDPLLELLGMLLKEPRTAVLFVLLSIASISDYRTYRIPNWLTGGGIMFGLVYSAFVPFSRDLGFLWALGGLFLGFAIMLPCYALRIMGAGDVKLMAMVGAFLGVDDCFHAVIYSFIVGGIAALGFALFNRAMMRMLDNVKSITQTMMFSVIGGFKPDVRIEASQSIGKLPYGICISIGTVGYVVARQLGYA